MSEHNEIFVAPCSREHKDVTFGHFKDKVLTGIDPKKYDRVPEEVTDRDTVSVWGVVSGNKSYWENLEEGDFLLFYTKSGRYTHAAEVITTQMDSKLGEDMWKTYDRGRLVRDLDEPWPYLIYLENCVEVDISSRDLHDLIGWENDYPLRFMRISDQGQEKIRSRYGSPYGLVHSHSQYGKRLGIDSYEEERAPDIFIPDKIEARVSRIIRNSKLAIELKEEYRHRCQICDERRRRDSDSPYAEVHHIHPLGHEPPGPDRIENMLVLCPNHHADFDYGRLY